MLARLSAAGAERAGRSAVFLLNAEVVSLAGMARGKLPRRRSRDGLTHSSELLDEALEQTFPARDPVAIMWT